jgi:serine/threonine-protein kinase
MVRGKYRIDSFIASGSMSNVYAATHRNGSRVALKILHKDLARDTSLAERFRREGYFGNAVAHEGIVRAIDDDMTDDGCAFLVFDLLEGETLEQKRSRLGGKLPLTEVLNIGDAVLDILQAAHDHQVLHRDLKPDNVYLTRKGEVKLFDFGAARFNDGKSSSEMTSVGMVIGTPAFMAPEQAAGKRDEVDARADVWGVGAMLFVCLTGQAVHLGGDLKTKAIAVARTKARSLRDVAPEIPRVVAAVIDRSLAFDKAERYADAKSMREALSWARRSLTGEDEEPLLSEDPETHRHRPILDDDDGPTIAREAARLSSATNETVRDTPAPNLTVEKEEEETEKRTRIGPRAVELLGRAPEIKRGFSAPSEGVVTSAPPVTLREKKPPSMPPSEGPTFSLRADPVFSLREPKDPKEKETQDALEKLMVPIDRADMPTQAAPVTERLPRTGSEPDTPKMPPAPAPLPAGMNADPAALFRAALERGMQATHPHPPPQQQSTTQESLSGQVPAQHAPRVIVEETPLPAPMPRAAVPLIMPMGSTTPGGFNAPMLGPGPTGPPPPDDPIARAQFRNESVSTRPPPGSDQFSSVRPGAMVQSVTAKPKGSTWRVLVPILIGILAGVGTYVFVMRQKAARAHHAAPAPAPASAPAPSASVSAAPEPLPSTVPSILPLALSASAVPSASVAPVASVPKKKPKPKPKPPPADSAEPPPVPSAPELL